MKVIFIVDDLDTTLLFVKTALDGHYKTYALPSAQRMFQLAEKIMPDLILLDVDMPVMDGFEAIKLLKADERLKSIPVIFLTGKHDEEYEIKGFELGAIDFITKPFSTPVLLKRIANFLEIDKLIKTVRQQNDELTKVHIKKDNILGKISHDLKNYIGVTSLALETFCRRDATMAENKYIKMVRGASNKSLALLNDILEINRIDVAETTFELTKQDINEQINNIIENIELMAIQKNILLASTFLGDTIYCMINTDKFQRIVENLLINAVKFTHSGGRIDVTVKVIEGYAEISCKDTGIGMTPEIIDSIFEQYTKVGRLGTSGETSTGLGLYIVKSLVDMHKGTIEVISEVGKGSEFIIKLPIASEK